MAMDPEQVKANVDAMGADVDQALADGAVAENGLPYWFGPDFKAGPDGAPGVAIDGKPV